MKIYHGLPLIGCLFLSSFSVAQTSRFDPVYVGGEEDRGNGVRFQTRGGCVTITAEHVTKNSTNIQITPIKTGYDNAVIEKENKGLDVAIIKQKHQTTSECPRFPTSEEVNSALKAGRGQVWIVDSNGDARLFNVQLLAQRQTEIEISIDTIANAGNPIQRFKRGMSGAVVVFAGVPVATLREVTENSGAVIATRLDALDNVFGELIAPIKATPKPQVSKPVKKSPYNINQLPSEYRVVVKKARQTKRRVESVRKRSAAIKIKSENASGKSRILPKLSAKDGYAHYLSENGESYYSGEVEVQGVKYFGVGYGLSEMVSGDKIGNKYYCRWVRSGGCSGDVYYEYAENEWNSMNWKIHQGTKKNGKTIGPAYFEWYPNTNNTNFKAWYNRNVDGVTTGVWEFSGGGIYEGEFTNNTWGGRGVVWDKEGQVYQIGTWNNGNVESNVTNEWRAGNLK